MSQPLSAMPYKKGDFIGQKYEVHGLLGAGGFGIVYLVYSHKTKSVYALKTFRDEYLEDKVTRERFRKEAQVWVDLERHPYLVRAYLVEEISGRLYITMEHIAPDEHGLNTLEDHLQRRPPDLPESLRWSIQFCHGMEYAYSRGIRAHRDIKPANIMIGQDKTVRIADFGLAGVLSTSRAFSGFKVIMGRGRIGLSGWTMEGTGFGTPTHMPPEQFTDAASCDETSDIYAFGVVLYQMALGGRLPFVAFRPKDDSKEERVRFWKEMQRLHSESPLPGFDSPLSSVVRRCLEKERNKRFRSFSALRAELEPLLRSQSGEVVKLPDRSTFEAWEWCNKGDSLGNLGRNEEAIQCYDRALEIDSRHAAAWCNKGISFNYLGRHEEALRCSDRALEISPGLAGAWNAKGVGFSRLGRHEDAARCFDRALETDPRFAAAWGNKGSILNQMGRHEKAIHCCDRALEIDPRFAGVWRSKGSSLNDLGRREEAIHCYDRALEIDPRSASTWTDKGVSLDGLDRCEEAIRCLDRALEIDPQLRRAWSSKGIVLARLGRNEETLRCLDRALEIDPRNARDWFRRARAEERLGRRHDAVSSYKQVLALESQQDAKWTEFARQRLQDLQGA